ncbi:MAG: tetratricopeptide repeat protein [Ktedonobacteraceae bacterium]|nr:tetratricopeptide repeat protein [Ktedonobacteraceae bacterium]
MNDQATYFQKTIKCGKARCKKCREEGEGHGPYWFVRRKEGNHTVEKYIGVNLPPLLQQVGRSPQSHLIGREQELKRLQACLQGIEEKQRRTAKSKHPPLLPAEIQHCFLLEGEAGMGKTRLAEEGARFVAGRKWTVVWGSAYPEERIIPYRPWIEVLRKVVTQQMWQQQEHKTLPQFYRHLRPLLPESLFPEMADESISLPQEPFLIWEAVLELLVALSRATPLLIVLDDLQWADASSLDLLAYLARRIQDFPILIIGTCRDTELNVHHPLRKLLTDLQREHSIEILLLTPLSNEQIHLLVSSVLRTPEMIQAVSIGAAGNPFFAEELAHTIKYWKRIGEMVLPPLPRTVSALLDHRLQGISSACFALLGKAAVLGRTFELDVLRSLAGDQSEDQVISLLEEALQMGLLTEEGIQQPITYHFWHPLLASHLYEQLSAARKASFHRRIADVFCQKYQNREEGADSIMYHLMRGGGEPRRIASYAEIAGNRAYTLSSYPDAARAYGIALDHLRQCPLSLEEQKHLITLLELLGECTRYQGKYEDARRWYEEALQTSSTWSTSASPQELQRSALLWCEIGFTWYSGGKLVRALECYQQSEQVLSSAGIIDGPALAYLRYRQSYVYWRSGNYAEALPRALEALHLFESEHQGKWTEIDISSPRTLIGQTLAGDPINLGRIHLLLGLITNGSGQYVATIEHWNTALAIFEQSESKRDIAVISCNLGDAYLRKADHESAQVALHRALTIGEQIGETPLIGAVCGNLGILALRLGKLPEAEQWLRKGITYAQEAKDQVYLSILHGHLAETLQQQGNYEDAGSHIHCCLSISRGMHIQPCLGLGLVALGKLHYRQALALEAAEELSVDRREQLSLHFLMRAKRALQSAIKLDEIEAETRTEAHIFLGQVVFLLGENDIAKLLATQALEEALRFELTWLIGLAYRVLGTIHSGPSEYFEQALHLFNKAGMRLEYASTLRSYAKYLSEHQESVQRGRMYLEEAAQIVKDEKADMDKQAGGV